MATVRRVPRLRSGRLCAHGAAGAIAEYDGNNNLLRKYIYGPGMKQIRNPKPATISKLVLSEAGGFKFPSVKIDNRKSQIENTVGVANAVYYYHFDAPFDYPFGSAQGFG